MESYHASQLILPTDKRNPCFTLYATEDQGSIRVFYGLELIEIVPDDPADMAFKMLAGRLYNTGVLVAKLEEVFRADRKTITPQKPKNSEELNLLTSSSLSRSFSEVYNHHLAAGHPAWSALLENQREA